MFRNPDQEQLELDLLPDQFSNFQRDDKSDPDQDADECTIEQCGCVDENDDDRQDKDDRQMTEDAHRKPLFGWIEIPPGEL